MLTKMGKKNVRKTNCVKMKSMEEHGWWNEWKKATPDAVRIKQPKTIFVFCLPILLIPKGTSQLTF